VWHICYRGENQRGIRGAQRGVAVAGPVTPEYAGHAVCGPLMVRTPATSAGPAERQTRGSVIEPSVMHRFPAWPASMNKAGTGREARTRLPLLARQGSAASDQPTMRRQPAYSRLTCGVLTPEMHQADNSCMPFDRHAASTRQTSCRAPGADLRGAVAAQLRRLFWLGRLPAAAWVRLCPAPGEIIAVGVRAVLSPVGRAPTRSQQAAGGADVIYLDDFRKDAGVRQSTVR
jgi:hypothetical protein